MRRALAALAAVLALVAWRYAPPAPRGADTPADQFSATRARDALARVLGDGAPHPTGTDANAAVRARLLAELGTLGLRPQVEERFVCGGSRCGTVFNVMARVPGTAAGEPAVLLACHYDSVWAGAGAADDGVGVGTVLETARALLAGPRPRRDVWLLIDDGEEQALLGAEAFVREAERVKQTAAVVNVEARGTTGPSLLFEMSTGNAGLVAAAALALPRPATNSIYYTIYQRLPNDTDLTVFKRAGMAGVNFAFVGGPLRYHTPRDDLAHLDLGSLQHHGDHALAMVRALADEGGSWKAPGDAVFFDVLTFFIVRWPQPWTLPLAVLGALLVIATVLLRRRGEPGTAGEPVGSAGSTFGRGVLWGVPAVLGGLVGALLAACVLRWLLRGLGALPYQWVAHAWPLQLAFWSAALAATAAIAWVVRDRLRPQAAWTATWIVWSLLALALAVLSPGVSYPLVVPVLVAGVAGVAGALLRRRRREPASAAAFDAWATLPPLVAAALLLFPVAWMLYDGMGDGALAGVTAVVALVLTTALPALAAATPRARAGVAIVAGVAVLVGTFFALALPRFTADAPQPLSLVLHYDARQETARWVAGSADLPLPPSLAGRGFESGQSYPWALYSTAWVAPVPSLQLPPPEVTVESFDPNGKEFRLRIRIRSQRGAPTVGIYAENHELQGASVEGVELELPPPPPLVPGQHPGYQAIEVVTAPPSGVAIELRFRPNVSRLHAYDVTPGVGDGGGEVLRLRPAWAVPIGRGDRTVVSRELNLNLSGLY